VLVEDSIFRRSTRPWQALFRSIRAKLGFSSQNWNEKNHLSFVRSALRICDEDLIPPSLNGSSVFAARFRLIPLLIPSLRVTTLINDRNANERPVPCRCTFVFAGVADVGATHPVEF
jgi:hypothetical protein